MTHEENKHLVQSFYEAGNRGDMDTCFSLISDEIVWTNIGTTAVSGTYRGKAELMEGLLGPLFESLKGGISSTVVKLIAEGDTVVAQTSGEAETKDGVAYNNTYCQVIRIKDGQFAEVTEYFDTHLAGSVFGFG
jgi:ketosteroid isomerase-like protein